MSAIYVLVHRVFEAGYLSLEVEGHLKKLMTHGCDEEDTEVLMMLRHAVLFGHVKRQRGGHRNNRSMAEAA
jgi:hypothetical protein